MSVAVLVVDDHPANLKLARIVLQQAGYEVRTASDADEALAEIGRQPPRAVLLDLQMPGTDGFALARRLRADPSLAGLPIMAVTAYANPADEVRARAAGCDDFVAKPIDTRTLPGRLAHLLARACR